MKGDCCYLNTVTRFNVDQQRSYQTHACDCNKPCTKKYTGGKKYNCPIQDNQ